MAILERDNQLSIGQQLQRLPGGSTLQDKWVLMATACLAEDGIDRKLAEKELCRDGYGKHGYGNLLNVEYRTNLIARGAPSKLTDTKFDVVIWSSGPNGTNEFGFGDDISLPQADEDK